MSELEARLHQAGIVAIIRSGIPVDLIAVANALRAGGIHAIEVTLNTPGALTAISALRQSDEAGMAVGAGTILCSDDARAAIAAGAQFIITPTFQPDSIRLCRQMSVPICCGCCSPTEMMQAHQLGANFIKVFPATVMGLRGIQAIREALPNLMLVPTGGVDECNLGEFVRAGCPLVALGSALVKPQYLRESRWDLLQDQARMCVAELASARDGLGAQ